MIDKSKKMQSEELENVYGGKDCYTKLTYERLKIIPHVSQNPQYHPLVIHVPSGSRCRGLVDNPNPPIPGGGCCQCIYMEIKSTMRANYCKLRSKELDPYHR